MKSKQNKLQIVNPNKDHYQILMNGGTANLMLMILISSITIIVPILLKQTASIFYLSTPFYITIVILYLSVLYLRIWGVLISFITLLVSGFFLDVPKELYAINTLINVLQVSLLLGATTLLRRPRKKQMYYHQGNFYFSLYNFSILVILLAYFIAAVFHPEHIFVVLIVLSILLLVATLIKAAVNGDSALLLYTLLVALLPSALCSSLSAWLCQVPSEQFAQYILVWTLSNYIFLQTLGYIFYQIFFRRKIKPFNRRKMIKVDVSTAAYYLAVILLNTLILYLIFTHILDKYGYIYFFPWALGNIFLLANLYFTRFDDASGVKDENRFEWYEKRIITVEKNTTGIITIISFILPLSVTYLKENIPPALVVLFAANIFFACLSVGLIWIPNKNLRFISLLKSIKTISYTFSITLLLISTIMIMFTSLS